MTTTSLKGKKIIVTGGAGFIGSHLLRRLLKEGADVHLFLRTESDNVRIKDVEALATIHRVDICDVPRVSKLLKEIKPDGIFHLAALNQFFGHIPTVGDLVKTNILATIEFMDLAKEYPLDFFVNTGTFAEVGSKSSAIREDDLLEPKEFYGVSRTTTTLYGQALGRDQGKPFVTVRVFTPYGPFVQKGKILYEAITRALSGVPINLTSPSVTRDYLYIDDLVDIYVAAALGAKTYAGHIFNGGSGVATTLEELAETVLKCTESQSAVAWGQQVASYDNARWEADMSKAESLLGFTPKVGFTEGVERTVQWFREHESYWQEGAKK